MLGRVTAVEVIREARSGRTRPVLMLSAAVEGVRQAAVISANAGRQDCIRRRARSRRPEMLP